MALALSAALSVSVGEGEAAEDEENCHTVCIDCTRAGEDKLCRIDINHRINREDTIEDHGLELAIIQIQHACTKKKQYAKDIRIKMTGSYIIKDQERSDHIP